MNGRKPDWREERYLGRFSSTAEEGKNIISNKNLFLLVLLHNLVNLVKQNVLAAANSRAELSGTANILDTANSEVYSEPCQAPGTAYLREASGRAVRAGNGITDGTGNSAYIKTVHGTDGGCA